VSPSATPGGLHLYPLGGEESHFILRKKVWRLIYRVSWVFHRVRKVVSISVNNIECTSTNILAAPMNRLQH